MHVLVFDDEADARIQIFLWVAGREDILSGCSEDAQWSLFVLRLHCVKEGATGIFGGGKGPLSWLLGEHWCRRTTQGKCEQNGHCKSNKTLAFKLNKNRNPAQHGIPFRFRILDKFHARVQALTYVGHHRRLESRLHGSHLQSLTARGRKG